MAKLRKIDRGFSFEELLEYENHFNEPFEDIFDNSKPQVEKVAYLGYICTRRDEPELTFDEYLDRVRSPNDAQNDAFKLGDETAQYIEELNEERALRMARWCLATAFPPSEYKQLTLLEQQAFFIVLKERNDEQIKEMKKARRRR